MPILLRSEPDADPIYVAAVKQVVERRVNRGLAKLLGWRLSPRQNPAAIVEMGANFLSVGAYLPDEADSFERRLKRFGQPYPGLYTIAGVPKPHAFGRPTSMAYIGALQVDPSAGAPILFAGERGSTLITDCAFNVLPDARFGVQNITIQSTKAAERPFRYLVHLAIIIATGERYAAIDLPDVADDFLGWIATQAAAGTARPIRLTESPTNA